MNNTWERVHLKLHIHVSLQAGGQFGEMAEILMMIKFLADPLWSRVKREPVSACVELKWIRRATGEAEVGAAFINDEVI